MDQVPFDRVSARRPAAPATTPELGAGDLARIFGISDLPERLAAVEQKIMTTLGPDDALLGPAAVRVAANGGKRLRPLFTIVTAALGDVFDDKVVAAAAAIELVQVGSLVHDDILDTATTRRGCPTINAIEGVNHAILAGDYILARAAELAAEVSREAAALVAVALGELCEGQVLEMQDAFDPGRSLEAYLASVRGKTAALFECACRLGAHCGRLSPRNTTALERFGDAFGMGFQVLDDVLDLIGDTERLGKPTGNDIASGVYTLPVLTALRGPGGDDLRDLLTDSVDGRPGHSPGEGDLDLSPTLEFVLGSGSVAAALAAVDRYAADACRAVAHLNQTTVGEGLAMFPRTYTTWALESFMDARFLEVPLTAFG